MSDKNIPIERDDIINRQFKSLALSAGDEGAIERLGCTSGWDQTWARVIAQIWGAVKTRDEFGSDEDYINYLSPVTAVLNSQCDEEISTKFESLSSMDAELFSLWSSIAEANKPSNKTVFQLLLNHFGYFNADSMNMKVEWVDINYRNHSNKGVSSNGWLDEGGEEIDSSLRFDVTLKLPTPPRRKDQPVALMDYNATGISVPFTS